MIFAPNASVRRILFALLVGALTLSVASDAFAQGVRGGRRRPKRPDQKTPPPQRDEKETTESPGRTEGTIFKFTPADEEDRKEDEKLLGKLKINPFEEGARTLILIVRDTDDLKVKLGDHEFERDEMISYFQKGLHVEADWGYLDPDSKRKIKKKVLRGLTFMTTVVEGKVEDVRDVGVEIRGVPMNDQQWPGYNPPDRRNQRPGASEKERVIPRSLKLKFIEDVTKVRNEDKEEADMGDFKKGDKVRVTAVYAGTKIGMLVMLTPPNVDHDMTYSAPSNNDDGRGKRPPKGSRPGSGRRPGGRAPQG